MHSFAALGAGRAAVRLCRRDPRSIGRGVSSPRAGPTVGEVVGLSGEPDGGVDVEEEEISCVVVQERVPAVSMSSVQTARTIAEVPSVPQNAAVAVTRGVTAIAPASSLDVDNL